jgi:4-hydroxy-tetrahydrodipicolinate synthase
MLNRTDKIAVVPRPDKTNGPLPKPITVLACQLCAARRGDHPSLWHREREIAPLNGEFSMEDVIRGLWSAVATPLDATGAIDHDALVRHCQWLLANGCDGLALFGTTGEGPSFGSSERLAAAEAVLRANIPPARIQLGTGCSAIPEAVNLSRGALALGLMHVLVVPPFYFRDVTEEGIEDAFAAIIDGVGSDQLRMTLYHIPQVSGIAIPAAVLGRLRKRYGKLLAGVKDSTVTGDLANFKEFRAAAPDCGCVVGLEVDIWRSLQLGGTGSINGMSNVTPKLVRAMFNSAGAEVAMRKAANLLAGMPFASAVKSVLAARTSDAAWRQMRPPMRPIDAAVGARIAAALTELETQTVAVPA